MFSKLVDRLVGRVEVNGCKTRRFWLRDERLSSFDHFVVFSLPAQFYELNLYTDDHKSAIDGHLYTFVIAENFIRKRLMDIFPGTEPGKEYEIVSYTSPYFIVVGGHSHDWTMAYGILYGMDESFHIRDALRDKR